MSRHENTIVMECLTGRFATINTLRNTTKLASEYPDAVMLTSEAAGKLVAKLAKADVTGSYKAINVADYVQA